MRGKNALYESIITSSLPDEVGEKGKRNVYLEQRDVKLAHRYYYHAQLCRLRYDDCLLNLSEEFSLSPNVIIQRLNKKTDLIKSLVAENKTPAELRKLYGYFNWAVMSRN
ncbi:hypothetical protein [Litoribacter populi]|uniref:hypothetical protein n=1 Tax=Litoribacter populi TaxID=2598460 RepID=UPI00117EE249|nr:hypothetical protein [Litoribacter populi]